MLFLSLNLGVQRGLRIDYLDDDVASVRPAKGGAGLLPRSSVGFQNQWAFAFDVELGWSW